MMRRCYVDKNFGIASQDIIAAANAICTEYAQQGFDLTLRQLYYQFVSRDLLPNTQQSYNRLGAIISDARMAGKLDWAYLVDRTRNVAGGSGSWDDPIEFMRAAARAYHTDWWEGQPVHVEVWVEKEALAGVVERAVGEYEARYLSCRGYLSQSEAYAAARRFTNAINDGKRVIVLHLGDHDPSGIDMTRDNRERIGQMVATNLAGYPVHGGDVEELLHQYGGWTHSAYSLERIALNRDQVRRYNPPPNPAKMTDSRIADYIEAHGRQSWELDALPPQVLMDLIRAEIAEHIDLDLFQARQTAEQTVQDRMLAMVNDNINVLLHDTGDDE